jgi:predicted transcriptional regulator YdeE
MPTMNIQKSIFMDAQIDKVHALVSNFHSWSEWSPWLICEPEAQVNVNDKGDFYRWQGNRVGTGEMKILENTKNRVNYDLTFLKPWKSQANVSFLLEEQGEGTQVSWTMESKMPFFMFFMKKKMEAFVGMDYERGLRLLKDKAEKGKIESTLSYKGSETFKGGAFLGIKTSTTMDKMGDSMKKAFGQISTVIRSENLEMSGQPFAQYHKFDFVTKQVEYTAGIPLKSMPKELSGDMFTGNFPETEIEVMNHKGRYEHIGNAWSAMVMRVRNKEFKQSKKVHPFEVYHNSPMDTAEQDLLTDVCFPKK